MDKDFLTYNQQMKHLRDDKHIKCNGTPDKIILCRYGYFNLVNGYKNPFVSGKNPTTQKHIYYANTSIEHLNYVKTFDDDLRMLLLKYIVKAEEEVRTFTSYKFDEINQHGKLSWYQIEAFDTNRDIKKVVGFISKAYSEISRSELDYVKFYMANHKVIPTWILTKVINFSTFIDLVEYSKTRVKDSLCVLYDIKDKRGHNNYKLLVGSLHWMRKVRNACAHNERLYSISRTNGRILDSYFSLLPSSYSSTLQQKIIDLLVYLKYYLCTEDYIKLITELKQMLLELQSHIFYNAFENVRASMGIKDISHLDLLLSVSKDIDYNKF